MSRKRALSLLVLIGIIAGTILTMRFLPKHYSTGESLFAPTIFWHDEEAFIFLDLTTTGRATNVVEEGIAELRYGYLAFFLGEGRFFSNRVVAYRLLPSGQLINMPLPARASINGSWSLREGDLQLTPPAVGEDNPRRSVGFRWDGTEFVAVPAPTPSRTEAPERETVQSDDLSDDDPDADFLTPAAREDLKAAGWRWKQLAVYGSGRSEVVLPIRLERSSFDLTLTKLPPPTQATHFDSLDYGVKSLELSPSPDGSGRTTVLWNQKGWQTVSKIEFDKFEQRDGRRVSVPFSTGLLWLGAFVFLLVWRFGSLAHIFLSFFTLKGRVLKNMGTLYSFPPAVPGQFPMLDTERLDYYTREFEGMGFTRLADFSLVSDAAKPIPSFCRLFVNAKHHCFGTAFQFFPTGKSPGPLKCTISCSLENGWDLAFGDRKPLAASALVRRRRGLGVSMPEATPYELLNAFLQMRSQVCQDLGISPLKNDTFEAYMAKAQASHQEIRESVKRKSFATRIPEVYWRKFSRLKTKQEYVWLGDYPKEAEKRKQGVIMQARAL